MPVVKKKKNNLDKFFTIAKNFTRFLVKVPKFITKVAKNDTNVAIFFGNSETKFGDFNDKFGNDILMNKFGWRFLESFL